MRARWPSLCARTHRRPGSPYWDLWICILPLRRVPPSGGPASTVMVNVSLVPGSPLSVTLTVKVHGASFLMQVPPNMAVLPSITSVVRVTLWTFAPRALLTYWRSPPTGPAAVCPCGAVVVGHGHRDRVRAHCTIDMAELKRLPRQRQRLRR